ncbi:MAG: hypothetical protein A3B68_02175 [Candidatus Melainabacteria bacterium RIFCSPHIGHO2_02_FULL_34_12]|nr:MAG: hypothetical protein A3B68_02175 [Candidatus Melainabacteria bacterium RIFCSPHIGHO2_02_FULL_34_12]
MDVKKVSLVIVGFIWFLVGIGLSIAGIIWILKLGFGPKLVIFTTVATLIGTLKGKFVLSKVASKYYKRADLIEFNKNDILLGWIKVLGIRGFILISIMMGLGYYLRHFSNIDRPILGIIYLAVGIALVYASKIFFDNKD